MVRNVPIARIAQGVSAMLVTDKICDFERI